METTKTLRERFEEFIDTFEIWCIPDGFWEDYSLYLSEEESNKLWSFIEQEIKLAEQRGEANMKQRVQNLLDDNDDYMDFERLFHYL